jgi:hypothetical protein
LSAKFKKSDIKTITHNHQYEYKGWVFFAYSREDAYRKAYLRHEELELLAEGVDPKEHLDTPLWIVYGPDCFPHLLLAKVRSDLTIWGWSIWRRQPGFRTLGMNLQTWIDREENPRFFLNRADAFARLAELIPEVVK